MANTPTLPGRTRPFDWSLWQTRFLAVFAVLVLMGAVVSDALEGSFWTRHALLASLVGSVIVVLLSVAVINEVVERRRRRRWSVLAQYVMFELVRNARMIWSGVLDLAGLTVVDGRRRDSVEESRRAARDTPRLTEAVQLSTMTLATRPCDPSSPFLLRILTSY